MPRLLLCRRLRCPSCALAGLGKGIPEKWAHVLSTSFSCSTTVPYEVTSGLWGSSFRIVNPLAHATSPAFSVPAIRQGRVDKIL